MADKPDNIIDFHSNQLPSLTIDWELYKSYLEDYDLNDDQKRELIETICAIMIQFVDIGFGIHPLQQVCEQKDENRIFLPHDLLISNPDDTEQRTTENTEEDDELDLSVRKEAS